MGVDNSARPLRVTLCRMEWQVGVLRSGAENIVWTHDGEAPDWVAARLEAIEAIRSLASVKGRQDYRVWIDGQDGIVTPGLDADGRVTLGDLDRVIPADRHVS